MLFELELDGKSICSDHSSAAFKASIECFPNIKRILCWPHIYRELTVQQSRLSDKSLLDFVKGACEARAHACWLPFSPHHPAP
jgi:hypothetical protein